MKNAFYPTTRQAKIERNNTRRGVYARSIADQHDWLCHADGGDCDPGGDCIADPERLRFYEHGLEEV